MKVAVYSGSFDPLHIGHLAIMERLRDMGEFDAVYLVVSPQNPLKSPEKSANADARLAAAREALSRHPELCHQMLKQVQHDGERHPDSRHPDPRHPELVSGSFVRVDDIEFSLPQPNYTIATLDALKRREPENDFTLVIGADSLCDIRRWKDWERILVDYGVIVYPRKGYDTTELDLEDERYRIRFIDAPMVDISSTRIRELKACGKDISNYII